MSDQGSFNVGNNLQGLNPSRLNKGRINVKDAELQIHVPTPQDALNLEEAHTFKNVMAKYLDDVNTLQHDADAKIQRFAAGEIEDLHEVTLAMDEAETSFLLMREMRDQLVKAYRELMSMQG